MDLWDLLELFFRGLFQVQYGVQRDFLEVCG